MTEGKRLRGRPLRCTVEQATQIHTLSKEGKSVRQIATVTGVAKSTVQRVVNPSSEEEKLRALLSKYAITEQVWKEASKHGCQICGSMDYLCVDHNHRTGVARGALCTTCNSGLGHFRESIPTLAKAIVYLSRPLA